MSYPAKIKLSIYNKRVVVLRQSRVTNRNIKWSLYCQYGQYSLTFRALALRQRHKKHFFSVTKGQCSKRYTILSVLVVHLPLYISISIYLQSWPNVIMTVALPLQILLCPLIYTWYFALPLPFNVGNFMQVTHTNYYILHVLFLILGTQGKFSIGF